MSSEDLVEDHTDNIIMDIVKLSAKCGDPMFTEWLSKQTIVTITHILHSGYLNEKSTTVDKTFPEMFDQAPTQQFVSECVDNGQKKVVDGIMPFSKGTIGEDIVYDALSYYRISDTSKQSYSGDFQIEYGHSKMMIEVKNYSTKVPTKEVNKFYRDIETSQCDCALFISLNSEITKKNSFEIELLDRNGKRIPCAFITFPTKEFISQIVKVCFGLTSINMIDDMKKVEKLIHKIKDTVGRFTVIESQLCIARESLSKSIVYLSKEVMMMNDYINEILSKLSTNTEYDIAYDVESVLSIVPSKFIELVKLIINKATMGSGDVPTQEKIQFTQKQIKFGEYELELLKTKVTFITSRDLIPKPFMTYKSGKWYIPVSNETIPDIISVLTTQPTSFIE